VYCIGVLAGGQDVAEAGGRFDQDQSGLASKNGRRCISQSKDAPTASMLFGPMRQPPDTETTRLKREMELVILTPPLIVVLGLLAIGAAITLQSGRRRIPDRADKSGSR
jgi:hypothetical protein